ncbi:hypothetical protein C8R42DRAFT_651411 [Lentinula raphanica]|nr:hypothetical protein C8R42DRAFT_651411 [Lentinula raphanica]
MYPAFAPKQYCLYPLASALHLRLSFVSSPIVCIFLCRLSLCCTCLQHHNVSFPPSFDSSQLASTFYYLYTPAYPLCIRQGSSLDTGVRCYVQRM